MKTSEKSVMSLRLEPSVHRAVSVAAARSGESMNGWCAELLGAGAQASDSASLIEQLRVLSPDADVESVLAMLASSVARMATVIGGDTFPLRDWLEIPAFVSSAAALLRVALDVEKAQGFVE